VLILVTTITVISLLTVLLLFFLMLTGVPIGFALGITGLVSYIYLEGFGVAFYQLSICTWEHLLSYAFVCVPLFILTGEFAYQSGFASDFYNGVQKWLSRLPGGLLVTAFMSCAGFAAVTGSSIATVASIGSMSYPELKKHSYFPGLSLAVVAAGGTLGILIPPSLGMVFYGIVTEQSIGRLFMAGIIPGILLALIFSLMAMGIALMRPELAPRGAYATWLERIKALPRMSVIPLVFVIIIGGIYAGIYTPTEAAGTSTIFLLLCTIVARRFSWKGVLSALVRAGQLTAMVLMIVAGGIFYARFLTLSGVIPGVITFITGVGLGPEYFLIVLIPLYIIVGMFLDIYGMMIITLPIVLPLSLELGIDPIFLGVYITLMCELALITPPVGVNTYVAAALGGDEVKIQDIFKWLVPFFFGMILLVVILIFFPQIALWLGENVK
jgi:tripartite ATP-independent transporter DctM subunit